jgi:hypothetical protein
VPYSPSPALQKWRGDRSIALDSLVAAHGKVVGGRRGRQYATEHLNRALFIALAGEFQGYCRVTLLPGRSRLSGSRILRFA